MQIRYVCPRCEHQMRGQVSPGQARLACSHCDWDRSIPADAIDNGQPRQCLACGCPDLWRQKDFPQRLGVAMVAAGAIAFFVAMAFYMPVVGIGILMAFAAVDLVLYVTMPDVLVCYRCQARHRTAGPIASETYFQLETFERYRQEAARMK